MLARCYQDASNRELSALCPDCRSKIIPNVASGRLALAKLKQNIYGRHGAVVEGEAAQSGSTISVELPGQRKALGLYGRIGRGGSMRGSLDPVARCGA